MKNKPTLFKKHLDIPLKDSRGNNRHLRLKFLVFLAFLIWLTLGIFGIYQFFANYSLRTPIIIQSPIVPRNIDVIISPVSSDSAKLKLINIGEIADHIFTLESSNGRNVLCPEGTYNGYGYRQNSFEWVCYPTQEEVRMLVIEWLVKNISKHGLEKSLCLYNKGLLETGCSYVVNYKSL
mgnify:CR=1 FL=1